MDYQHMDNHDNMNMNLNHDEFDQNNNHGIHHINQNEDDEPN